MGFFKKIFKPVSKVLDKVIPNEVKPFLPYLAAFAPVFGPTAGMFGSTIGKRALTSGLLNIGGQLAQEGNEGDINLLSAGLGALTGAMTTPGAATQFRNMQVGRNPIMDFAGPRTGLQKATDFGLEALAKGSDIFAAGMKDPFSVAGVKAAALPAATATGDLMFAQAKRDQDAYEDMMAAEDEERRAADANRALAIRRSMEAYGATEEEILEAIEAAGYKKGGRVGLFTGGSPMKELGLDEDYVREIRIQWIEAGKPGRFSEFLRNELDRQAELSDEMKSQMANGGRVGFRFGGIDAAIDKVEDEDIKESVKMVADMPDMDLMDLIEEFEIIFKRKPMSIDELKQFYRETYEMESPVKLQEKIKEKVTVEAKDGGLMDLGGKEMDLRKGGFVPIGKKERADDVPARLSKNEFVMTADAVRAAGGGSVNEGAKRMYKVMNDLEARA